MFRGVPRFVSLALLLPIMAISGCGRDSMGQVRGKIVFEGKPVPVGTVTFAPTGEGGNEHMPGKAAVGGPDKNGEFTLSTYKAQDGAHVGKHLVTYTPPQAPEANEEHRKTQAFKDEYQNYLTFGQCRLPAPHYLEVKPGQNEFTLELKKGK